jgi:hypothetical protein
MTVVLIVAAVVAFILSRGSGWLWIAAAIVAGVFVSFVVEMIWIYALLWNGASVEEVKPYGTIVWKGMPGILFGYWGVRVWRWHAERKKSSDA